MKTLNIITHSRNSIKFLLVLCCVIVCFYLYKNNSSNNYKVESRNVTTFIYTDSTLKIWGSNIDTTFRAKTLSKKNIIYIYEHKNEYIDTIKLNAWINIANYRNFKTL